MIINHNMNAMNAHRNMGINNTSAGKSMEKLSSGLRINRAGDDAAGLAISEKMRGQIRGLDQASRNSQDGISMIQTAEGALNETQNILQRMRELSVQSSNDTNTAGDREEIQKEIDQLAEEIDRIGNNTEFNTQKLLNGNKEGDTATAGIKLGDKVIDEVTTASSPAIDSTVDWSSLASTGTIDIGGVTYTAAGTDKASAIADLTKQLQDAGYEVDTTDDAAVTIKRAAIEEKTTARLAADAEIAAGTGVRDAKAGDVTATDGKITLQVGANEDQVIELEIGDMRAEALKVDSIDVKSKEEASKSITIIDDAIKSVSSERAKLGAVQNRLEYTTKNLDNTSENLQAAESRIRDVDMAKEMLNFSKNNILQQASQSMLAQAKSQPEGVLQLLR